MGDAEGDVEGDAEGDVEGDAEGDAEGDVEGDAKSVIRVFTACTNKTDTINSSQGHRLHMKKIGLALGCGGAKGLAHIAFLKVFDDLGIKPSIISGTSMGAVIGALYASGLTAREIEAFYWNMTLYKITNLIDLSFTRKGLTVRGKKISAWIRKRIKHHDFSDLEIPMKIVATDFWKRSETVFDTGDVVDAVRASISLPGIFQPYLKDGRVYIDGGVVNPVPYDIIKNECDLLIAIDVYNYPADETKHEIPNTFESIYSTYDIMYIAIEEKKRRLCEPDIYVRVALKGVNLLDFHLIREIYDNIGDEVREFKKELISKLD